MKHILTILFALLGFTTVAAQEIPQYDVVEASPVDGSTVSALTTITVSLGREGYDAPLGIMPGAPAVEAVRVETSAASGQATEVSIAAPRASVKGGLLLVTFAEPYNTPGTVVVRIPAGLTNNLAMPVATMTTQEIIDEGGCTNPAITLTFNVETSTLPVKDVTGVGYDAQYLMDADGNYIKDEKGQYVRQDKYDSLVDAQLTPAVGGSDEGDRVTVLYFWYDEQFASANYRGGASVTNVTTGVRHDIASVSFKTGGDSHRNDVIELRLSTADYIYSDKYHQGVYEVVLPEGIATTADGRISGGKTFRFTFGDPSLAYVPETLDLDPYLGKYKALTEDHEEDSGEGFTFEKDAEGNYFVNALFGSSLRIPVYSKGEDYFLQYTSDATTGLTFKGMQGGDVGMMFQTYEGHHYIFLDQYAICYPNDEFILGGLVNFLQESSSVKPDGIQSSALDGRPSHLLYDLSGRRITQLQKGVNIVGNRKIVR